MPLIWSGVAVWRQGPGDWIRPGQLTTVDVWTILFNARRSVATSGNSVYVAEGGPPGSAFWPHDTLASAPGGAVIGLQMPGG